jgi:hypothetical protein
MSAVGVYDPVTKMVTGGRGGNRLAPGHPARVRRPYSTVRELPPDPVVRDRMAKEHAVRAISQAAEAGELVAQEVAVLLALVSFAGDALEPVFPTLAKIGARAGGMRRRTAGRWLAGLVARGWLVRMHRFIHYRDPATRESKMRGTSCLWRLDVPARWLDGIRDAAQRSRETTAKNRPTPKAPQNQGRRNTGGRRLGVSQAEWGRRVEAARVAAAARQAETSARLEQSRTEVAAPPPPDLRAGLRRPKDESGPGP